MELLSILTLPPGNILYHLVLLNSISGALQAAFTHWRSSEFPQARRTMVGLGLLLAGQLILFLAAGLGWQQVINIELVLPPLDRAIMLISLIWIIWLWAFPEPSRAADSATALLSFFVLSSLAPGIADALHQTLAGRFNASFQEMLWQFASIGVIAAGALLLLIRRPSGWGNGLAALMLAFIGHMAYLLTDHSTGDFPGAARLMYLAVYPILLTLPQRFPAPSSQPVTIKQEVSAPERRRYSADPKTFHALLDLAAEANPTKVSQAVTRAIAQTMLADLCFLIYLTDNKNQMVIASGYDLIREEALDGGNLTKTSVPMLASAIQRGRPLRLPASATSADIKGLSDALGVGSPGNLLVVPMLTKDKDSIGGILMLSPYSNRLWSAEDQSFLANIAVSLVGIVQRTQQAASLQQKEQAANQAMEQARARLQESQARNEQLVSQLEAALQRPAAPETDFDMAAAQEQSRRRIEELEREVDALRASARRLHAVEGSGQVEKELRIALEDIARLQNQVAESNIQLLEAEKNQKAAQSSEQTEVVASISQELRQPMSSIVGYTDLLLGESVGILGALQRKFVERIKASTERIGSLIDDLIQVTTLEAGIVDLKAEAVDLNSILDNAMSYTSSLVREKNIAIHLDLPKQMTPIHADREALQQILIHLLQNAAAATPVEGRVTLKVQARSEGGQDYVLIQVADTGGGIPAGDLQRVFTRLYRADNVLIQGVGDTGVGLSIAKTLTEAQRGRIWVEAEAGVGSTFSVLLPFSRMARPQER